MSELAFQRQVDDLAKAHGWRRFVLPTMRRTRGASAGTRDAKGWPDRCYFRRGHLIVLEMKADDGGNPRPDQVEWLDEWTRVADLAPNVHVAVVRPSNFDGIAGWFR